jgi:hypothetical protein
MTKHNFVILTKYWGRGRWVVYGFNVTFNNISVISWRSVLPVEEIGVPGENHRAVAIKSLTKLITRCCIEYTSPWAGFELTTSVVIGSDFIGSCKSNYHTITTTTAPKYKWKLRKVKYHVFSNKREILINITLLVCHVKKFIRRVERVKYITHQHYKENHNKD